MAKMVGVFSALAASRRGGQLPVLGALFSSVLFFFFLFGFQEGEHKLETTFSLSDDNRTDLGSSNLKLPRRALTRC